MKPIKNVGIYTLASITGLYSIAPMWSTDYLHKAEDYMYGLFPVKSTLLGEYLHRFNFFSGVAVFRQIYTLLEQI